MSEHSERTVAASDLVMLELPLHPRHASTARAVASSVAADAGFGIDDIEDLRLGVNEAVSVLADVDAVESARLSLRFERGDGMVRVVAQRIGVDTRASADGIDVLAQRILSAVVDEFGIDGSGAFTVVKRASTSPTGHDPD